MYIALREDMKSKDIELINQKIYPFLKELGMEGSEAILGGNPDIDYSIRSILELFTSHIEEGANDKLKDSLSIKRTKRQLKCDIVSRVKELRWSLNKEESAHLRREIKTIQGVLKSLKK